MSKQRSIKLKKKTKQKGIFNGIYEPEFVKLNISHELQYKDNLSEEHFLELRQYLAKKAKSRKNDDKIRQMLSSPGVKNTDIDLASGTDSASRHVASPAGNSKNKLV